MGYRRLLCGRGYLLVVCGRYGRDKFVYTRFCVAIFHGDQADISFNLQISQFAAM